MSRTLRALVLLLFSTPVALFAQYHFNQAGVFSGSSYIAVPHAEELAPTSEITIEAWICPTSFPLASYIVEKNYKTSFFFGLQASTPTAVLWFGFGSGVTSYAIGRTQIAAGVWTHVAVTYDRVMEATRFYVNGRLDSVSRALAGPLPSNTDSMFIGAGHGISSPVGFFRGNIDEVRIWNIARPGDDIARTMFMPLAVWHATSGTYRGLVAAYRMNGNAYDQAGQTYEDGRGRNMTYADMSQKAVNHLDYNNTLVLTNLGHCIAYRPASTDATSAITVEAWVRRDTSSTSRFQTIVGKTGATGFDYQMYLYKPTHQIFFNINTNQLSASTPVGALAHERWTHVAATYSSANGVMTVYVNGDSVGGRSMSPAPAIGGTSDSVTIGNGTLSYSDQYFSGQIDEVRIWKNKARTQSEIRSTMFKGITWTTTPAPTAATVWNFDGQNFDAARAPSSVPSQEMHFRGTARMSSAHQNNADEPVSPLLRDDEGGFYGDSYAVSRRQFEIPDETPNGVIDSVYVPAAGTLSRVRAFAFITHDIASDLHVTLTHPNGTSAKLFWGRGYMANDIAAVFSDDADSVAGSAGPEGLLPPFSPLVKPKDALSLFNGFDPKGWWKLKVEDVSHGRTGVLYGWGIQSVISTAVASRDQRPDGLRLEQNYPNPFNPATTITYEIARGAAGAQAMPEVSLKVYDLLGREVATLVDERKGPGIYTVTWDASRFASGVYLYRLRADRFERTMRMILIR